MSDGLEERTPFELAIIELVRETIKEYALPQPGRIESYDEDARLALVQPLLQSRKRDGALVTRAAIPGVPVWRWAPGGYVLQASPKAGDECWLDFSGRSLERWKAAGGIVDPADGRVLHRGDAVAFVGGLSRAAPEGRAGSDLYLGTEDGGAGVVVTPDGRIGIGTAQVELFDAVSTIAQILLTLMPAFAKIPGLSAAEATAITDATSELGPAGLLVARLIAAKAGI